MIVTRNECQSSFCCGCVCVKCGNVMEHTISIREIMGPHTDLYSY